MMYFFDTDRHHLPHVHVKYGGATAVIGIQDLDVLNGELPRSKLRLVLAWMEIHRDELMANWELAANGEPLFRIEPLK